MIVIIDRVTKPHDPSGNLRIIPLNDSELLKCIEHPREFLDWVSYLNSIEKSETIILIPHVIFRDYPFLRPAKYVDMEASKRTDASRAFPWGFDAIMSTSEDDKGFSEREILLLRNLFAEYIITEMENATTEKDRFSETLEKKRFSETLNCILEDGVYYDKLLEEICLRVHTRISGIPTWNPVKKWATFEANILPQIGRRDALTDIWEWFFTNKEEQT